MKNIPIRFYKNPKYDQHYFTIIIKTLDYCNYSCIYCCENCNITKYKRTKIDLNALYNYINDNLQTLYLNNLKLKISLYGGEPTLHPDLYEFCKKIYDLDKSIYLEMFTNFSKSIDFYNKLLELNVKLIITYHYTQFMTHQDFYNKIIQFNHNYLSNNFIISIMYEQQYEDQSISLINNINTFFNVNNIKPIVPILLKNVRDALEFISKYSKQHLMQFNTFINDYKKFFKKYYILEFLNGDKKYLTDEELEQYNLNFNYWLCSTGSTSLYIHTNGNIYRCVSYKQLEDKINYKKNIGNIFYTKQIIFNTTLCSNNYCSDYDSNKENIFKLDTNTIEYIV